MPGYDPMAYTCSVCGRWECTGYHPQEEIEAFEAQKAHSVQEVVSSEEAHKEWFESFWELLKVVGILIVFSAFTALGFVNIYMNIGNIVVSIAGIVIGVSAVILTIAYMFHSWRSAKTQDPSG